MEQGTNKSYRIRTEINKDSNVLVNFTQEYETFELLSLKLKTENLYRLHNANYGIVVGRVQANGGFGVPNAKISIFIEADQEHENSELLAIYGYTDVFETNSLGNTYNLLPDEQVSDCHKKIGAFPSKRYLLDNDTYIEVYDKYYKYTTRTNNAGDYIIVGVPIGNQTLHMDLDLSDCGILSQRPRDFVYKGYNIEQFDNPNQFKSETGASINFLSQYVQQTKTVYVNPLWGNNELGETLGITRADIDVNFKFEPTCVFMGSVVSDSRSNGITMKCVPTSQMGMMDELTTGKGTIEMIRKTPTNSVEEFQIKGNELIDGNGTWCYQIPMNLDYITTNEYGETVATDNPNIGIPTRARVRFRVSLDNFEESNDSFFAGKVLVPNNPQVVKKNGEDVINYDYVFGTETGDDSYRDLFWNNVYTVKQHIPRIQKSGSWRTWGFTGIKQCNFYGQNNPIPYNSIRINLPFMYVLLCALIKTYVRIVAFLNAIINAFFRILSVFIGLMIGVVILLYPIFAAIYVVLQFINVIVKIVTLWTKSLDLSGLEDILSLNVKNWPVTKRLKSIGYVTIADGICPDLETWYFAPMIGSLGYCPVETVKVVDETYSLCQQTIDKIADGGYEDTTSIDYSNKDTGVEDKICITKNIDYLMTCIEMNLAQEYKVIKFDFYNDWINGMLYIPRWKFRPEHKITFLFGLIKVKVNTKGCFDDNTIFGRTRWLTQHCSLGYKQTSFSGGYKGYSKIGTTYGCSNNRKMAKCHKSPGIRHTAVFGSNGGMIHRETTLVGQHVYYYKPSEMTVNQTGEQSKINMFATDIVLLGSLKDCDENGIPQSFKWLSSSSYKMPTNLALTNLDEAGVLFVDGDGYCVGGNDESKMETRKIGVAENSFSGQVEWSASAPAEIQIMGYENSPNAVGDIVQVASDRIALTEAAGISWNYTGPSQAERDNYDLFSPGGHFLGMSCVSSRTNIKSCVNLQRICEAGATMSERIEKTRGFKIDDNGNYKQQSVVFSPNGLISTDEVIAGSFRNMFATMNLSPLVATKKDKNTGYLTYDFTYVRANGFDGSSVSNIVAKSNNYNRNIGDTIPKDYVYETGDASVVDIDPEEREHTFHRAIEATNFGYYRFRFGIKSSDAKEFNKIAASRYALTQNGLKYLPQYENSFYFYFGLKDGNTAIDRFYSDFFSMCPTRQQGKRPNIRIKDSGMDYCTKEQSIWITCDDIDFPYDMTLKNGGLTITANGITYKSVQICGLIPGEWEINTTDSNGFSVTKKVKIGANIKGIDYAFDDFKEKLTDGDRELYTLDENGRLCNASGAHPKGGELSFDTNSITVFGKTISSLIDEAEDGGSKFKGAGLLLVSSPTIYPSDADCVYPPDTNCELCALMLRYDGNRVFSHQKFDRNLFYNSSVVGQGEQDRHRTDFEFKDNVRIETVGQNGVELKSDSTEITFYLWQDKRYYTLYFIYKCDSLDKYLALELCKVYSEGYEAFNVFVGSKFLKYNGKNSEGFSLSDFLSGVTNSTSFSEILSKINNAGGATAYTTQWALRQALFDQRYDVTVDSSDRLIRCTNIRGQYIDGFLFGQPEKAVTNGGVVSYSGFNNDYKTVLSTEDYSIYGGYEVDDTASLLPSMSVIPSDSLKLPYFRMAYDTENGLILSEPIKNEEISEVKEVTIETIPDATGSMIKETFVVLKCSDTISFREGRGYILKSIDDESLMIQCSYIGSGTSGFVVPLKTILNNGINIKDQISGKKFSVYPTLCVPIIHKPFYFEAHPFILGQFTVIGKSTLRTTVNFRGNKKEYKVNLTISGVSAKFNLTYGDRDLSYKLERDSSTQNCPYINDYIRIYGGNGCGPEYYLSESCSHFGNEIYPISVKDNVTGNYTDNRCIDGLFGFEVSKDNPDSIDTIDINLSTGLPSLDETKDENMIKDLTAFTSGSLNGLGFSTSYSLENLLPKEIVIRKKKIKEEGVDEKTALIKEDCYLDVGDADNVTANDVNKHVKLYMIIIPDEESGNNTVIGDMMNKSLFDDKIANNTSMETVPLTNFGVYNYPVKTANQLFSGITLSDYFSNPSAIAFLFDQIIQSSFFSYINRCNSSNYWDGINCWYQDIVDLANGIQRGGYFHKPQYETYKDPGFVFGTMANGGWPYYLDYYDLYSPFNSESHNIYKAFDGKHYDENAVPDFADVSYSRIASSGTPLYTNIALNLALYKHGEKKLFDVVTGTTLHNSMTKFGYGVKVVRRFDSGDTNQYPTSADTSMSLCDTITDKFGINFENEDQKRLALSTIDASVLANDCFDKIIGENWSFPNLEYYVSGAQTSDVSGTCIDFSESIEEEYKKEKPNYAGVIAKFFINNRYNATDETEDATLLNLFNIAKEGHHESFIVPIVLGENRDSSGAIKSSFIWPGNSNSFHVYRDKKWVVNADTEWGLGHPKNAPVIKSTIEESIYDENMSYGFRSIIIGIYDGPGIEDENGKTGNKIRPFKIYTFHSKGLYSNANYASKFSSTHEADAEFNPNDYYNKREDSGNGKQKKENLGLYHYHKYENDYDEYASGWC